MCLVGAKLEAQTHIRSQGASMRIPPNARVQCSGNLIFEEGADRSSDWVLDGTLCLQGNLINEGDTRTYAKSFESRGKLILASQDRRQYILGSYPMRISRLVLDNPKGLGLAQDIEIVKNLTFLQGKVYTGPSMVRIFQTDSTSISNYGPENYIVGNLRRYLTQGKNTFPIGSDVSLQLLQIEINQIPDQAYVDASFHTFPGSLTSSVEVDGGRITELLDNGVWKLASNMNTLVNFDLTLEARGFSNAGDHVGMHTFLIDKGMGWESIGHSARATGSASQIRVSRKELDAFGEYALGKASYVLSNPTLLPLTEFHVSNNGSSQRNRRVSFNTQTSGAYNLELRDIRGRMLQTWHAIALPGKNEHELDLTSFPKGIYLLTLIKDGQQLERKIW